MSELSRVVGVLNIFFLVTSKERSLLEVSELEQELANNHSHSDHVQLIQSYLRNPKVKQDDLLRILML